LIKTNLFAILLVPFLLRINKLESSRTRNWNGLFNHTFLLHIYLLDFLVSTSSKSHSSTWSS
jgi:hypothetical protein